MANFFQDAFLWPQKLLSSDGRAQLKSDIKKGEGSASIGNPLHGLTAGAEMTKLGSAYRGKQTVDRLRDGQNPFSGEFIQGVGQDQVDNISGAFKENWPVLAAMFLGGGNMGAGGGSASGAASGGSVASSAAGAGAGLEGVTVLGSSGVSAADVAAAALAGGAGGAVANSDMGMKAPATSSSGGFDFQGLGNMGSNLLQQGQQSAAEEERLIEHLARLGPPPNLNTAPPPGTGADILGQYRAQLTPPKVAAYSPTRMDSQLSPFIGNALIGV